MRLGERKIFSRFIKDNILYYKDNSLKKLQKNLPSQIEFIKDLNKNKTSPLGLNEVLLHQICI